MQPLRPLSASDAHAPKHRRAFTLVEVVIASALFVLLAAGVLGTTVMVRRSINQALTRNIAFDAAQGFLDQIKGNVKFQTLLTAVPAGAVFDIAQQKVPDGVTTTGGVLTVTGTEIIDGKTVKKEVSLTASTPSSGAYTDYALPINTTNAKAADADAFKSVAYTPSYGLKLELAKINDPTVSGTDNAVLVTLRFHYKNRPGDTDFKTGAVSFIANRVSL